MNFHIYHTDVSDFNHHDWAIDEVFVRCIVNAYLKGEYEVLINGNKYTVGQELLIYENQISNGASGVLIEALNKSEGTKSNFDKKFFEKKFKNVTDKFLLGRSWGELKGNYYNVYINDGKEKPVILVLNKIEVDKFLEEWAQGNNTIWTGARRIDLVNPKSIKIFDINFDWLSKDRGDIKSQIKRYATSVHQGSFKIEVLEYFGKEITDKFEIKPFGSNSLNLNKKLSLTIEGELDKLAKVLAEVNQVPLPSDILSKGKEMSEAYHYLYFVENYLRSFIEHIEGAQMLQYPTDVIKTITKNKANEAQNKFLPLRGDSDLFYCDFVQLQQIISNNWKVFKTYFPQQDQHWLRVKIEDMYRVRNLIAHCGYITKDDLQMVKTNFRMIVSQLKS